MIKNIFIFLNAVVCLYCYNKINCVEEQLIKTHLLLNQQIGLLNKKNSILNDEIEVLKLELNEKENKFNTFIESNYLL